MTYPVFLKKFFLFSTIPFLIVLLLNYIVDPLQVYRKASFYTPHFSVQQRYQNPGLAKNYDYDTIIVGTSMTENFRPSYLNEILGVKALKLSISGSTASEQNMIANFAIGIGKVERVIWDVHFYSFGGAEDAINNSFKDLPFPHYLYDDNIFNDVNYLFNNGTTMDSLEILLAKSGLIKRRLLNLDGLNNWHAASTFSKEATLVWWTDRQEKQRRFKAASKRRYTIDKLKANVDKNFYEIVKANPEIEFNFFYPPYSILQHKFIYEADESTYLNFLALKEYFYEKVGLLENVKIYDLQSEAKITFHLDNYKDLSHYSEAINEYIIDSIKVDNYLVTEENYELNTEELLGQVKKVKPEVYISKE